MRDFGANALKLQETENLLRDSVALAGRLERFALECEHGQESDLYMIAKALESWAENGMRTHLIHKRRFHKNLKSHITLVASNTNE